MQSYKASAEDELSFDVGVMLKVVEKTLDGWWLVRYTKIRFLLTFLPKQKIFEQFHFAHIGVEKELTRQYFRFPYFLSFEKFAPYQTNSQFAEVLVTWTVFANPASLVLL